MKLVDAFLCARKDQERYVFTPLWLSCGARASLFKCGEGSIKEFSPQWRTCEARAILFKCQQRQRKQFSPLWKSCEARTDLFMSGEGPKM